MSEGDNGTICTDFLEINKTEQRLVQIFFFFLEVILFWQQMSKDENETHSVLEKITLFCVYFYKTKNTQCSFVEISCIKIGERLENMRKFNLRPEIKYDFRTNFQETHNFWMTLRGYLSYRLLPEYFNKYRHYGNKFIYSYK